MGMMKKVLTAGVLAALPMMGSAATLSVTGGSDFVLPIGGTNGGYDPSPAIPGVTAGATVKNFNGLSFSGGLEVDGPAKITFTYMGKEASYNNTAVSLVLGGSTLTDLAVGATISFNQLIAGLVQFKFESGGGGSISNASSTSTSTTLDMAFKKISDTSFYAFFGDGGGGNDDDLDDMIIRIDATPVPVPVPAAGFLLIGALGGLAALRRRKTA
jgi:hypothetical protein